MSLALPRKKKKPLKDETSLGMGSMLILPDSLGGKTPRAMPTSIGYR